MTQKAASQVSMHALERVIEHAQEEIVWISEDQVFDILFALCDLLHEDGCARTSFVLEVAIDEFLSETGKSQPKSKAPPRKRIATKPAKPMQITDQSERAKRVAQQSKRMAEVILKARERRANGFNSSIEIELPRTGTD